MVVRSDQIYVERDGVIEKSGRRFISDKVTESIIERIVAQVGRRIDKSQPLVDARLPDGSRVNAIIPPLAVFGPCLTVRKFPIQRLTMDDLIECGTHHEGGGDVSAGVRDRSPQRADQRRHGLRQDDDAERRQQLHPLQGTDRDDRGHLRVAAAPGARGGAGKQAGQHRGRRRVHDPRPGGRTPCGCGPTGLSWANAEGPRRWT